MSPLLKPQGGRTEPRRGFALAMFSVLAALAVWRLFGLSPSPAPATPPLPTVSVLSPTISDVELEPEPVPPEPPPVSPVVGVWEDDFYGKRRMTFRDDGTATMELELDPVSRLLYGPKLIFHIAWKQDAERLILQMTGGEPPEATKTLAKLFGETSEQTIESLTAEEMRLRSSDSGKVYIHRRIAEPSGEPAADGVE